MTPPRRFCLLLLLLSAGLAGCSSLVWPDQPQVSDAEAVWLSGDHSLGQTFVALEGGLSGIEIYLAPDPDVAPPPGSQLQLDLLTGRGASDSLARASLALDGVRQPGFYRLDFAPQPNSQSRDYFVRLTLPGAGRVRVGHGPGPVYLSGALYHDDEPVDAQMAFHLVYAPAVFAWAVLGSLLRFAGWLLLAVLLLVVPGWALLGWVWPASGALAWAERLGLAAGLGFAVYPLLFLWTHLIGLNLGPLYAWLPLSVGALGLLARGRAAPWHTLAPRARVRAWWRAGCGWPDLALVAVMGLVFLSRWWAARLLDLPLWGDSVTHTMVVQLILDHGGLFSVWAPYAELQSLTYHFGFHALVAAFHWLSGLSAAQATLWMGQILNGVAVLALYPLGVRLARNRWGGVMAVLVAGLLSTHPSYYTNWGRYTQLAGQVLLPVAVYFTWAIAETQPRRRALVVLATLIVAALALTHYRVLLMYAGFVVALLALNWRRLPALLKPLLAVGAGAGLLALPWMLATLGGPLLAFVGTLLATPPVGISRPIADFNAFPNLRDYSWHFWLAAVLGALGGLARRRGATLHVLLWWGLLVVLANPAWVGLPGTGLVNNFAVFIAVYIGASLLAAAGAAWLAVPRLAHWGPALLALTLAVGAWGFRQRMNPLDTQLHVLATRPDLRAAAWIDSHLPAGARLLANAFFAYGGTVAVGGDAGWWLPLLARRAATLPPINYTSELGPVPEYPAWVRALPTAIRQHGLDDPAVLALLKERGVTHAYIGQRQEQSGGGEPFVFSLADLLASPHFRPVYHEDRVWVFEFLP